MEEEVQELKHVCKLCNKTFPCGRSLGGHMRSHVINSAESDQNLAKKKFPSLRENPKKAFRFTDSNGEALLHNKLCKECGRGFQSWKALFGHMKCHSERFLNTNVEEEEDSWTSSASQSDNPKEIRSSGRGTRTRRYMMGTANSLHIANNTNNASSSSVSVIEQDQEEVARCLIMLSKDVGNSGLNSPDESSDNNFEFLQPKSSIIPKNLESGVLGSLNSKFDNSGVSRNGLLRNDHKTNKDSKLGKNFMKERRRLDRSAELSYGDWGSGKRSKFECTTCNKSFHSYQALGGHRASHKKIKGCSFASKIDSSADNSIEETAEISPAPPKSHNNEDPIDEEEEESYVVLSKKINNNKGGGHECPICFKVFSSGQALGGHKRSHLICGGGGPKINQTIVIHQKPSVPEIRDLLDLNLPAPVEEESSSGFKPWWGADNLKHDQLFGLLS